MAVFLALAIGVLMGTTVVNQGVIDTLRAQANNAVRRSDVLRKEILDLRAQVRDQDSFALSAEPWLLGSQLLNRRVALVTAEGVDPAEVDGIRRALGDSDATVMGVLQLTLKMRLDSEAERAQLAEVLGLSASATPAGLQEETARQLAQRLDEGPSVSDATDVLETLVTAGFVAGRDQTNLGLDGVGGPDQAILVLSGGSTEPIVQPDSFFVPLVAALAQIAHPTAAVEPQDSTYPFVPLIREDGTINNPVVTVDNGDTIFGRIGLVLAVKNLLETGRGGHYGVKAGSSGLLPKQ